MCSQQVGSSSSLGQSADEEELVVEDEAGLQLKLGNSQSVVREKLDKSQIIETNAAVA